ncbi:hypothetical protein Agub_g1564, partial [Astrephomene gubernaculifera]
GGGGGGEEWTRAEALLAAIRNLAASERGRQELAADPATVPCLLRALAAGGGIAGGGTAAGEAEALPQLHAVQLSAAAALANLSSDRCGLEAMVAEQELLLPQLWGLARSCLAHMMAAQGG